MNGKWKNLSWNKVIVKYKKYKIHSKINKLKHEEKKYCIIKRTKKHEREGLFATWLAVIKMTYMAEKNGFIPVVDMQTEKNAFLKDCEVGERNAWDFYFKQPGGVSLDEINNVDTKIYLYESIDGSFPNDSMDFLTNKDMIQYWRTWIKEHIQFSEEFLEYFKRYKTIEDIIISNSVLAVCLRGTDYTMLKPCNHCIAPSITEAIQVVDDLVRKNNCKFIYLSTEDKNYDTAFKDYFGEKIITINQQQYYGESSKGIAQYDIYKNADVKDISMRYLSSVYLMSMCKHFFGARCCGSIGAVLYSKGFSTEIFWNEGRYRQNYLGLAQNIENSFEDALLRE